MAAGSRAAGAAQERILRASAAVLGFACAAAAAAALWMASDSIFLALAGAVLSARVVGSLAGRRAHGGDTVTVRRCKPRPVISRKRLLASGDQMLERCRARQQPFALAVVQVRELAEVQHLFGEPVAEAVMQRLAAKLQAITGRQGLAARTAFAQFALLLPGREAEQALMALRATFGRTGTLEHDSEEHELVLLPDFKVDAVGVEHKCVATAYDALWASMPVLEPAGAAPHAAPPALRAAHPPQRPGLFPTTMPVALQPQ